MADLVQIGRSPRNSSPDGGSEGTPGGDRSPEGPELPPDAPAVYLETFGCQMNEADSALIAGRLRQGGYRRVQGPEQADVILINTCAIREKAEDRVWGRTSQLLRHRSDNPGLVIGITGCMAEHLKEKVATRAPYIRVVAGPDSYRNIATLVDRARTGEAVLDVKLDKSEVYEGLDAVADDDGVSGQVTIQRGCDKFCTFCVVPYTRGRERGVPPREVLRNVRRLAERGYVEVMLLGQTVNSYRWDDADFADLLRAVAAVDGIQRIRFTSPYPVDFSDRVIEVLGSEPKMCPQLHLPAQSGSDVMLERMRRGYTRGQFVELVDKLRTAVPGIALSTDLMVGFCGETEADHEQTLSLMRQIEFDSAFMFRYSDRGITYASRKLEDDIDDATKARRLREVIELQETHTRASHQRRIGTRQSVLIHTTAKSGDRLLGRTPHFQKVLLPIDAGAPGDQVEAEITRSTGHTLFGELPPT